MRDSDRLTGLQEIANYLGSGKWYAAAMVKAMRQQKYMVVGGAVKGSEPRTTRSEIDKFEAANPGFIASDYMRPNVRTLNL